MFGEACRNLSEYSGAQSITCADEVKIPSLAKRYAFIHPIVDAAILLGNPADAVRIALDDLDGAVGRASIYDDIFQKGAILRQHRLDRRLETSFCAMSWGNDRQEGHVVGSCALTQRRKGAKAQRSTGTDHLPLK